MDLSVACNWDKALIDGLWKHKEVASVFGKLGADKIGGGRAASGIRDMSRLQAEKYIQYCQEKGIKFHYLYNAACLGGMEFSTEGRNHLLRELDWAAGRANVDAVIVSTNYLLKLTRKRYPKLKVILSVFLRVWKPEKLKYFEDLGVHEITLGMYINRDFKLLEKLRKTVGCHLRLFVNQTCLFNCPNTSYHARFLGHASQTHNRSCHACVDYNCWTCIKRKLDEPEEILKSRWIRPEDIKIYEDMGYDRFKLTDRTRSSAWLIRAAEAYINRSYGGDLVDILALKIASDEQNSVPDVTRTFKRDLLKNCQADRVWLKGVFGWGKYGRPHIDNRKLDGYIDFFRRAGVDCFLRDCSQCGWCKKWADKVISFKNEEAHQRLRMIIGQSVNEFLLGNLFAPDERKKSRTIGI
ncbi:MAG: U32 family peptidase [Candidatus Omnitrophota bacterium]